MGGPFPVMVPVPEVRNHISRTALTVHFFHFLARVPLQSRKSLGKRIGLRPPAGLLERRRKRLIHWWRLWLVVPMPHVAPPPPLVLSALHHLLSADASPHVCLLYASPPGCLLFASWLSVSIHNLHTVAPCYREFSSTGLSYMVAPRSYRIQDLSHSTFLWLRFTTLLCKRYSTVRSCSPTRACMGEPIVVVA